MFYHNKKNLRKEKDRCSPSKDCICLTRKLWSSNGFS